jgi:nitric oxide reductase activation protein
MRVPFDPQAFVVPAPYRDDNSYLWDHGRTAKSEPLPQAGSVVEDAAQPELSRTLLQCRYAEWDHRLARLRNGWCTVLEDQPQRPVASKGGRSGSAHRAGRRTVLRAQATGEELDLPAAVAGLVDLRRGAACDTRWFLRRPHAPGPASVLLLLDLSASTLDRMGAASATVLDAEKMAALSIARHLLAHGYRVAIHGFSSNTRAAVRYRRILEFGAVLDEAAVTGIRSLAAGHSTRLGAALRHALDCAAGEAGAQRAVLVLTDGAPSDIDVFDADYLVQDARMAAGEAYRRRIRLGCIAFDPLAQGRLRTIFGWRHLHVAGGSVLQPRQFWQFCEGTLIA